MDETSEFLTAGEVGKRLRLSSQMVRKLIANHEIRANRFGGVWRIAKEDLQIYINRTATITVSAQTLEEQKDIATYLNFKREGK